MAVNVMGTPLQECSTDPLTGFFRDGCCNTGADDLGIHTVCALVTEEFLAFSKDAGNDLSTPRPGFPACNPVTDGACVHPAGRRLTKPAWHRRCCWPRPTS